MPGWHEATKELLAQGKFKMVGIIQEQHPDRCRLFMQWKKMGWPVMVDSLDLLGVKVVPITLAIDEHGIIRHTRLKPGALKKDFLNQEYPAPAAEAAIRTAVPKLADLKKATNQNQPAAWRAYGDGLYLWGGANGPSEAIAAYQRAAKLDPDDGVTHFRLAVAFRKRYDSKQRQADDFRSAVAQWQRALDIDPNHYIRRRRIQQYGPRLMKPYPFYDWVPVARKEIEARGDVPHALPVEPGGAELARPARRFDPVATRGQEPDAEGRITRDTGLIDVEVTVVPSAIAPGKTARVHLVFRPKHGGDGHWNNEAQGLTVYVDPPQGWRVDRKLHEVPNPNKVVSEEDRRVEFEVQTSKDTIPGDYTVSGYALYYACQRADGKCVYRRRDVNVKITVK